MTRLVSCLALVTLTACSAPGPESQLPDPGDRDESPSSAEGANSGRTSHDAPAAAAASPEPEGRGPASAARAPGDDPEIRDFFPRRARPGTGVMVWVRSSAAAKYTAVTIGGMPAAIEPDRVVRFRVPVGARTGELCVLGGGDRHCGGIFTVLDGPVLDAVETSSPLTAGDADREVEVRGEGFDASSVVVLAGTALATVRRSSRELIATIPRAMLASGGVHELRVDATTEAGRVHTGALPVVVTNPEPHVFVIEATKEAGRAHTMTVRGVGFVPTSVAEHQDVPLATTYVSPRELVVGHPDVPRPNCIVVYVRNPAPGGGFAGARFNIAP
ncbi:MAG: hypothetical protein U0169_02500 [Polyangiaceae bacterium]